MSGRAGKILLADDHPDVLAALKLLFKGEGYRVAESASPAEAVDRVKAEDFDVALIDLNYREDTTSGKEGLTYHRGEDYCVDDDAPGRNRPRPGRTVCTT